MSEAHVEHARPGFALPASRMAPAWAALVLLAGLAWAATLSQARGMGIGAGTMGMGLPLFLGAWLTMMIAMMFPSVAPIAIMWSRVIGSKASGGLRVARMAQFLGGYLVAWTGYGLVAFASLLLTERLAESSPTGAIWLGAAIFGVAGLYQLTPLKDACLRHCRSPMMALLHYANFKGASRDFRVGLHHGAYCVGCCWGLMIVLVAVGVMNVAAMAALAAVIFLEKLWKRGPLLSKAIGLAFLALAVLVPFFPTLVPALHAARAPMQGM